MKKFISIASLTLLGVSLHATTLVQSVPASGWTNINTAGVNGLIHVTQFTLTSAQNGTADVVAFDTPNIGTNPVFFAYQKYTNAAYSTISKAVTNLITAWTNYYGVTNYATNKALVSYSNYVAAANGLYPQRISLTAATNTSVTLTPIYPIVFTSGLWLTNSGNVACDVTVTFSD